MDMLRKLLNTINRRWAQKSSISRTLRISRGVGNYPYLTVKEGSLFFHAYPHIERFNTSSEAEEIKQSYLEDDAGTTETEVVFRADFIKEIINYGSDDIYLNFNDSTTTPGTITLKGGEALTEFPRRVRKLYYRAKTGLQPFEILGYYTNRLYYQEVVLEGLTIKQLVDTLSSLGYLVDTSDAERLGMVDESALVLMDISGQSLEAGADLYAFRSNWHRVLYPIHRVLTTYDGDVDTAIEQLMLPSARGEWLDYWAGFLRIKRLEDESDELMLKRIMLTLTSAKSNNMAMEELISYYIGTQAKVLDAQPAQIEVRVDPLYMDTAGKVRDIIALLKSAAVDYFINYQKSFDESYPVYFLDRNGKTIGEANENYAKIAVTLPIYAEDYQYVPPELRNSFKLNSSKLNSINKLSKPDKKVVESLGMTLRDSGGNVIQSM